MTRLISRACARRTTDGKMTLHRLTPIGVAMAAADTFDPFKD